VVTERPQVDLPHKLFVARKFSAKLHAWMVKIPPGSWHTVLARTLNKVMSRQGKVR